MEVQVDVFLDGHLVWKFKCIRRRTGRSERPRRRLQCNGRPAAGARPWTGPAGPAAAEAAAGGRQGLPPLSGPDLSCHRHRDLASHCGSTDAL